MRPRPAPSALCAALLLLPAAALGAQVTPGDTGTTARPVPPWERRAPARLAVGGAALYQGARGSGAGSAAGVGDGGGFDAFAAVAVSALALGVGYQQSTHGIGFAGAGRVTDRGVFVEPRVSVAPFRNFNPYVALRGGIVRRTIPGSARFAAETRSLTTFGAGVGTLVSVAPGVALDVGALALHLSGGDQVAPAVVPGPFLGGTGWSLALRAGVVVGLDRWNR